MCGRYTLIKLSDLLAYFPWIGSPPVMPEPRFNIAPSQSIAVVANESEPVIDYVRWGLVPSWSKDGSITAGSRMINARSETLADKPAFSRLLKRQRCLIPADGFFEWKKQAGSKTKIPHYFQLKDVQPFAFAGLWDHWRDDAGHTLRTATIITTSANDLVAPVHNRMPVILPMEECRHWIEPHEMSADQAMQLLAPYPANKMTASTVSLLVGSPANEGPELIKPVEYTEQKPFQPGLFET